MLKKDAIILSGPRCGSDRRGLIAVARGLPTQTSACLERDVLDEWRENQRTKDPSYPTAVRKCKSGISAEAKF
eukprot:3361696-Rhodomonas_salina.1